MTAQTLKRFTIGPAFSPIAPAKIFAFCWFDACNAASRIYPNLREPLKISEILPWPADRRQLGKLGVTPTEAPVAASPHERSDMQDYDCQPVDE